jgi:hypothetical protein
VKAPGGIAKGGAGEALALAPYRTKQQWKRGFITDIVINPLSVDFFFARFMV